MLHLGLLEQTEYGFEALISIAFDVVSHHKLIPD